MWRDFEVRATYAAEIDGLHLRLVRDGYIRLRGRRLSLGDQVALRGIFSKTLAQQPDFDLLGSVLVRDARLHDLRLIQFVVSRRMDRPGRRHGEPGQDPCGGQRQFAAAGLRRRLETGQGQLPWRADSLEVTGAILLGKMDGDFQDQQIGAVHHMSSLRLPNPAIISSSTWTCSRMASCGVTAADARSSASRSISSVRFPDPMTT